MTRPADPIEPEGPRDPSSVEPAGRRSTGSGPTGGSTSGTGAPGSTASATGSARPSGPPGTASRSSSAAAPTPEAIQRARRRYRHRFGRFLRHLTISTLIPGTGLVVAGRKVGFAVLGVLSSIIAATLIMAVIVPRARLLALGVNPDALLFAAIAAGVGAFVWLIVAVTSMRALEPAELSTGQRLVATGLVIVLASSIVGPLALASRYALVQRDLVSTVFVADEPGEPTPTASAIPTERVDPWKDKKRVTVLLIGGDGGPNRIGVRPDSMIVATIDTVSGDTLLVSLPRNLQRVPFPKGSPLSSLYPNGFQNGPESESLLNAVYSAVPALHPGLFVGSKNPGADATKLAAEAAIGLQVDYYVMVNLAGFQRLVNALGGIDITVKNRIPIGNKHRENGTCTVPTGYIEKGRQHLNGYQALWYSRARCGGTGVTDDYDRMRRQRCVIGAVIDQADPATVLRRYQQLAGVTKDIVSTDIPQKRLSDFVELALNVKDADVASLPFTNKVIQTFDPDYDKMRRLVRQSISEQARGDAAAAGTGTAAAPTALSPSPTVKASKPTARPARDESAGAQELSAVC